VPELVHLENDACRVAVAPQMGGGIAAFTARTGNGDRPVLRPLAGKGAKVFDLAQNVLVPFSNRISGGGFSYGGAFHQIAPNLPGEVFPIHGDGFQKPWSVLAADRTQVRLHLDDGRIGPYRYTADLTYRLEGSGLTSALRVTNTGAHLPFGGGFHPWLPRLADTTLSFEAATVWLEDNRHLPTQEVPVTDGRAWDFRTPRGLPQGLINNAFTGWAGTALVTQPALGIAVEITAQDRLTTAIVYSPGARADFFCFEPVSQAVDAHNRPGQPGLTPLATGESLEFSMIVAWRDLREE
jgi:aldose 1-epimerase